MKAYDVIVIGSGSGSGVVEDALNHGLKVAYLEKGKLGGTCLNTGCIPSKMLLATADRIMDIRESAGLGIRAEVLGFDFAKIMGRMRAQIELDLRASPEQLRRIPNLDFYSSPGRFVGEYILEVGGERIRGKNIVLASGARPRIPPVKGLEASGFLTNETILDLEEPPSSLLIIGGGYVAAEYAHFFAALGTRVIILQRGERIVPSEDPEISAILEEELRTRVEIHTGTEALEAQKAGEMVEVRAVARAGGEPRRFKAAAVLVAAGRESNADLLDLDKTGVDTDERGFIRVDDYLETNKLFIWALGDATGRTMFKHASNRQASLVSHSIIHGERRRFEFGQVPRAIFTRPEIAAVGMSEPEAKKRHKILVGRARFSEVARGKALADRTGLVKVIVERDKGTLLGCHVIGPSASILIQEVVNALAQDADATPILASLHIHPALSEVVPAAFAALREPD